ncbi:hypothetical protein CI109_103245 [Kwoniella shandongensis]|uniref:Uncharacterized protein n=1 Tax=Kwoniella shandongensis TaxID=1734106 RepID=A0A5M6BUE3_9TREE|nr:uncharacterized protein CI109_006083 [Kwoniella shandongensis]KAA5525632.1 hypothetical protein CI109_006083 [Kwoniella shandongensis]
MSPSSPAGSSSSSSSSLYTNTLLALPDGPIPPSHLDLTSHCVSLLGGYPTFPPLPASAAGKVPEEVRCGVCHKPMPLLAQVYCPPENGENDRTIYVWGCARVKCQKREGSVRAFRASIRNEEYVRDVEEKRAAAEKAAAAEREKARKNPFTISSDSQPNGSALFGTAQPLFGAPSSGSNPFAAPVTSSEAPDLSSLSISSSTPSSSTTLAPPLPAYQPAQYLSTIEEYIPPVEDMEVEEDEDSDDEAIAQNGGLEEAWEKILPKGVDEVFENFVRRLEAADGGSKQVLRYELGGMPLPYSTQSPICKRLFPGAEKPLAKDEELDLASLYNPSSVPPCPQCKSKRTFELQLVPSLISVLKPNAITTTGKPSEDQKETKPLSEEERKKELERLAAGVKGEDKSAAEKEGEMEWGTVLVYGCEKDCVGLVEEWVGVEWETSLM